MDNIGSASDFDLDVMSSDWIASYDIERLCDKKQTCHIEFQLPAGSIFGIVRKARMNNGRFEFPVAFSRDLRQITILNYLVRLLPSSANPPMQDFSVQSLELDTDRTHKTSGESISTPWYQIVFSPNAKYIAVLKGPMKPSQGMLYEHKEILVFEDVGNAWESPGFQFVSGEHVRLSHFIEKCFFAFHTTQAAMAIALLGETNLWFFKEPGTPMIDSSMMKVSNIIKNSSLGQIARWCTSRQLDLFTVWMVPQRYCLWP
jgi:hypothetical protein